MKAIPADEQGTTDSVERNAAGRDGEAFESHRATGADTAGRERNKADPIAPGIFDSSYLLDRKIFWGQYRLEFPDPAPAATEIALG